MTVAENVRLAVPQKFLKFAVDEKSAMRSLLDSFGFSPDLEERVSSLTVAQSHILELTKAFAVTPKILILDEPTAPLGPDSVRILFDRIKQLAEKGTAIIYITHRLAEVRKIADQVTILRDGEVKGSSKLADITDQEILTLIIGRHLDSTFPPKHLPDNSKPNIWR